MTTHFANSGYIICKFRYYFQIKMMMRMVIKKNIELLMNK